METSRLVWPARHAKLRSETFLPPSTPRWSRIVSATARSNRH